MLAARPGALAWAALLLAMPAIAHAQDEGKGDMPRALHEPVRLTAGGSNQWMGVLAPAGDALYFVSDRNATAEVFIQKPVDAGPRLLFEHDADISWPLPGPDGTRLAFISYRADATGDMCVYQLGSRAPRCLTGLDTAELQPMWLDGGRSLGVLTRPSMHGNYELRRLAANARRGDPGQRILERNMLGASVSPDGRWLAYVPIERTREQVGVAFANRSGRGVMMQRLEGNQAGGKAAGKPVPYVPDLPGLTGATAFAPDGAHLYFAQYLNDTNGDGAIDGNDHSVLFRVPFAGSAARPVTAAWPEQLTSAQWNCRYPMPARDRLIVTCAHQGSLDIYALPLAGAVPPAWDAERVRGELHVARNHWTKLLLSARLASLVRGTGARIQVLRHLVRLHVDLGEHESALYYSEQIARLAGTAHGDAAAWAEVMRELIRHRREDVRLTHGQLSDRYVASESERAARLADMATGYQGDIAVLASLVRAEVQDDLGHKDQAQRLLEAVALDQVRDPLVLEVHAERARATYALRGERDALLAVYRELATHPALDTVDRLRFAEHFVKELLRGVPRAQRQDLVAAWVERLQPESELALMIQVSGWLLQLDPGTQEDVRKGIFELYKGNRDPDRRRALVLATVRAASRQGNEYLQYQFATSWASWLRRSEPERKHAEALYRQVVLERAYTELSKRDYSGARASFYGATMQTTSLEAHIGFIEARLREGRDDVEETYAKRFARDPGSAEYAFVQAYLLARRLPALADPAQLTAAVDAAIGHLRRAAGTWPRSMEIHHVWGTALHQRALRTGSRDDALAAHSHYLLALDLARSNPRFAAALERQLGLLQAALGNHRIALDHFARRDRLPYVRPEGELSVRMAMARSAFHAGDHSRAVSQAERALALIDAHTPLARYRPLALDRLALYLQGAGEHERALALYRALIDLVDGADAANAADAAAQVGMPINRIKARVGAASAALGAGHYQDAIARVRDTEALLTESDDLRPAAAAVPALAGADVRPGKRDYEIILAGLLAQSYRGQEDYAAATTAMARRRELLSRRFDKGDVDEDLLELARTHYHLAEYAYRQGALERTRGHLEQGLRRAKQFERRTGSGVSDVGLRLLQAYAELHLYGGVDLGTYALDLKAQLTAAYDFICKNRSPSWEQDRFLFAMYLTMLELSA